MIERTRVVMEEQAGERMERAKGFERPKAVILLVLVYLASFSAVEAYVGCRAGWKPCGRVVFYLLLYSDQPLKTQVQSYKC